MINFIKNAKNSWFELLISLIIIASIIFYVFNPELTTFLAFIVSLILVVIKSVKQKQITEPHKLALEKIEEILKDIHTFQEGGKIMTEYIYQKIYNLEARYERELKELGCYFEKIDEEITITLNLGKEKLIAKPEHRIEVRWEEGHRFLRNYEEIDEELKKFKKK